MKILTFEQERSLIIDYLILHHDDIKEQVKHLLQKEIMLKGKEPIFEDEIRESLMQRVREILLETLTKHLPITPVAAILTVESLNLNQLYIQN